jgi:hypothetical protein
MVLMNELSPQARDYCVVFRTTRMPTVTGTVKNGNANRLNSSRAAKMGLQLGDCVPRVNTLLLDAHTVLYQ